MEYLEAYSVHSSDPTQIEYWSQHPEHSVVPDRRSIRFPPSLTITESEKIIACILDEIAPTTVA
jgi:hypothetical protein